MPHFYSFLSLKLLGPNYLCATQCYKSISMCSFSSEIDTHYGIYINLTSVSNLIVLVGV